MPPCSGPRKWQKAVHSIPQVKILPLGGFRQEQLYTAWRGDKFLGATAAKVLSKSPKQYTRSSATIVTNTAFSNSFFKANIKTILPDLYQNVEHLSDHCAGTVVEAAVGELFEVNESAVEDLTRWLIKKAEMTPDQNAKGNLLNLGGKVNSSRIGGGDHTPLFQAIAEFDGYITKAEGTSKKKAEQNASAKLLSLRSKAMTNSKR